MHASLWFPYSHLLPLPLCTLSYGIRFLMRLFLVIPITFPQKTFDISIVAEEKWVRAEVTFGNQNFIFLFCLLLEFVCVLKTYFCSHILRTNCSYMFYPRQTKKKSITIFYKKIEKLLNTLIRAVFTYASGIWILRAAVKNNIWEDESQKNIWTKHGSW